MSNSILHELNTFVASIAENRTDFYRRHWSGQNTYQTIPITTRADLVHAPLNTRRYLLEESPILAKIVRTANGPFVSEWTLRSIGRERFGVVSARPTVYMQNFHEALEKTMWCYEQNVLPLTAEVNPNVAAFAAQKFRADSLITDQSSLEFLEPHLRNRRRLLESISIIGDNFDVAALRLYSKYTKCLRLVLALPETGAFAEAEYSDRPLFLPHPDVVLEHGKGMIVTKITPLITPIIKYQTELETTAVRNGEQFELVE